MRGPLLLRSRRRLIVTFKVQHWQRKLFDKHQREREREREKKERTNETTFCVSRLRYRQLHEILEELWPEVVGRVGGQVVSMLAFFADDPGLNPAEAYSSFYL